jgi:hypothetical protein
MSARSLTRPRLPPKKRRRISAEIALRGREIERRATCEAHARSVEDEADPKLRLTTIATSVSFVDERLDPEFEILIGVTSRQHDSDGCSVIARPARASR